MTTCCGGLERINKLAELPFERPLCVDEETHSLYTGPWGVQLFHRTPNGNVSQKYVGVMRLAYCPFCGSKLTDERVSFAKEKK